MTLEQQELVNKSIDSINEFMEEHDIYKLIQRASDTMCILCIALLRKEEITEHNNINAIISNEDIYIIEYSTIYALHEIQNTAIQETLHSLEDEADSEIIRKLYYSHLTEIGLYENEGKQIPIYRRKLPDIFHDIINNKINLRLEENRTLLNKLIDFAKATALLIAEHNSTTKV